MSNYFRKMEAFFWFAPSSSPEYFGHGYIKLSVIIDKKRTVFSTGIFCKYEYWRPGKLYGITANTPQAQKDNRLLQYIMLRAGEINTMLRQKRIMPTSKLICKVIKFLDVTPPAEADNIESRLFRELCEEDLLNALENGQSASKMKLLEAIRGIESYKPGLSKNTLKGYKSMYLKIERYLTRINSKEILAEKFTVEQGNLLSDYFLSIRMKPSTINLYMSHYREALTFAASRGHIAFNPLASYRFKNKTPHDNNYLTSKNIVDLGFLTFEAKQHELLRDAFLFMCYTGLHYIDYHTLTRKDIVIDEQGKVWLEKKRIKSKVEYCQKMHPFALQLISRYGTVESLPRFEYYYMWKNIARLGVSIGYQGRLCPKIARKTFAFMCLNLWRYDLDTTAKMMGLLKTDTIAFYAKVGRERVDAVVKWQNM